MLYSEIFVDCNPEEQIQLLDPYEHALASALPIVVHV